MKALILILSIIIMHIALIAQEKVYDKHVVFIHGAWSTGSVWNNYEIYFKKHGITTIAPAFLYHSVKQNDSLIGVGIEDYVDQIEKLLKSFDRPPMVVAHSMGCIIAQRLATKGLIEKMVLIAPPVNYGMIPPKESIKSLKWLNKVKHLEESMVKPTFDQALNSMLNNLSDEKQRVIYSKMTYESGQVMKEIVWIKNLFGMKPNKIQYSKIDIPVLFVSGGLDKASPPKVSEKLYKKFKSKTELKKFDNNAHWMMEENNWEEIAEYIFKWIEQ